MKTWTRSAGGQEIEELKQAGRDRAAQFTLRRQAEQTLQVYDRLLV